MGYSKPIYAADFADFESYVARIQQEWDAQWKRVYSADWSGVAPHQHAPACVLVDRWAGVACWAECYLMHGVVVQRPQRSALRTTTTGSTRCP